MDIIIATERLLQVIAQRKDLKPECCYVTVSHLFQYVIGLFQENNYRNSEFVDGTRKLFRKYMCLILTCRAIPWKENLCFFIWSGNIFAKWKKNSLDKEGMKMAKIYMYAHGGSGNHGCEAIVRSTCDMLNNPLWDEILLISSKTEEDIKYGLDKICTIKKDVQSYSKITLPFIRAYIALKLKK